MAITSVTIVQDNIKDGCNLMAVHSPLKFTAYAQHSSPAPYTFPEYLTVEVTTNATTYTYKAWQYDKVADKCYYIFMAEKIIRSLMTGLNDDAQTADTVISTNYAQNFNVKFISGALSDNVDIVAYKASRQLGDYEALESIFNNDTESIKVFANREFYLHYYFDPQFVDDGVDFDGVITTDEFVDLLIRKKTTKQTVGRTTANVYRRDVYVFNPTYGYLYNSVAANNVKLIPSAMVTAGWRLPSKTDFDNLIAYAGGNILKLLNCRQVNSPVTECNTTTHPRWDDSIYHGTNDYDLAISPGGYRATDASFSGIGTSALFYTSSANPNGVIKFINNSYAYESGDPKKGCSVRLVRNATAQEQLLPDGVIDGLFYSGNDGKNYINIKIGAQVWTSNLGETKLNDNSAISVVTSNASWVLLGLVNSAICLYNNDSQYLGTYYWHYFLDKTFNIDVLPNVACGLYVKFFDYNTGYYKHWLFDKYYEMQGEHESYGTVENFSLNLRDGNDLEIGKKFKRKMLVSVDLTQEELNYISGIFSSPRIYYQDTNGNWIPVKLDDSTNVLKYPKNNSGVTMFTFTEAQQNTVTML